MGLLSGTPCPCGCGKIIVSPLFGCQCSSLYPKEANELIRRWNYFEAKQADVGEMFPLAEDPLQAECDALGISRWPMMHKKKKDGLQLRAILTGEERAPNQNEWYLSGAIPEAYRAPYSLTQVFHICKLVLVQVTTVREVTIIKQ